MENKFTFKRGAVNIVMVCENRLLHWKGGLETFRKFFFPNGLEVTFKSSMLSSEVSETF